jgi:hypothetical protein
MNLKDEIELAATREKLDKLQKQYEEILQESGGNKNTRTLTLYSLKQIINRLSEDISRHKVKNGG